MTGKVDKVDTQQQGHENGHLPSQTSADNAPSSINHVTNSSSHLQPAEDTDALNTCSVSAVSSSAPSSKSSSNSSASSSSQACEPRPSHPEKSSMHPNTDVAASPDSAMPTVESTVLGEPSTADEWKNVGNTAFAAADYVKAIACYSSGIELEPTNIALFSNRSAAYLRVGDFSKARRDASMCIQLNPTWHKGWWRLGQAQMEEQDYKGARETFVQGLQHCGNDENFSRGLENAKKRIAVVESVQGPETTAPGEAFDLDQPSTRPSAQDGRHSSDDRKQNGTTPNVENSADNVAFPGSVEEEIQRILAAPNHYAVLHVSPESSPAQLKKNYYILARMLHPDKCSLPNSSEAMSQVSLAYDTLTNVVKRTLYDQFMSQTADGGKAETYTEWEARQQPVEVPKWLRWLLEIKGCAWILLIVIFLVFLPLMALVFLLFLILWILCLPYRLTLQYCFPERYAKMQEVYERERARAEEAHLDKTFAHV